MSTPTTMRALQQTSLQGPQDTRLITDAPVPRPDAGEVLLRVTAAGVNFVDISRAYGTFLGGPQPPCLAGFEAAGEVVDVGEAVTGLQPGAVVVGVGDGAFAILILRDVLTFSAAESAEILGTTTTAVKSGLQRARARLNELEPEPEELLEPTDRRARALLDGYIAAFDRADASLLERVLRVDATLEATPFREWQSGRTHCIHLLDTCVLGSPGDWRMIATTANGQPAAAVYNRDADGVLRGHGIVVLAPTATGLSRVIEFHDPTLLVMFGFSDGLAD